MHKKNKILVLGGSGFIGTNLLIKLKDLGYQNLTATSFIKKNFYKVKKVKYLKVNAHYDSQLEKVIKGKDVIFILSANSSGAAVMEKNPLVHLNPNIRMNMNILECAYKHNIKKVVFVSSNTVYPDSERKMNENDVNYNFFHKYHIVGWMKVFSEKLCEIYANKIKNPLQSVIIVRPSNLYGPYDKFSYKKSKVIAATIRKFEENKKSITVWGDGSDIKDFLYIKDFCDALIKVSKTNPKFEVVNICSGKSISLKKVINFCANIYKFKQKDIHYDVSKPNMIPKRYMSNHKMKTKYKFKVKTDILDGLKETVKWYRKNNTIYNNY
jgi:GDP-L-fucose synthase